MVDVDNPVEVVADLTAGAMADVVMDIATVTSTVPMAIELAEWYSGRVLLAGLKHFQPIPNLITDWIVMKSLAVFGGSGFTPASMAKAVEMLESGTSRAIWWSARSSILPGLMRRWRCWRVPFPTETPYEWGCAMPASTDLPGHESAKLAEFEAEIYARNDRALLGLCEARIDTLLGRPAATGVQAGVQPTSPRERSLVDFVEQYVLDAQLVTDGMCAELNAHFSEAELSGLTTAIAFSMPKPATPTPWENRHMRIAPPAGGLSLFDHQPELFASFNRFYGTLWSEGVVDQATKEVGRIRNARVVDCGI